MSRTTIKEMRDRRLRKMSSTERLEFDEALTSARLAVEVSDAVRGVGDASSGSTRQ